jgi:hypothetical protein
MRVRMVDKRRKKITLFRKGGFTHLWRSGRSSFILCWGRRRHCQGSAERLSGEGIPAAVSIPGRFIPDSEMVARTGSKNLIMWKTTPEAGSPIF